MLLTITYKGENATDLGFLLFKNPQRPQEFQLNYGKAYVFYPEANSETCTAALLLDINPIDLARGKIGSKDGGLFDYVNDRPYVSSSFMSTAISKVFGTAMTGRCDNRPELATEELDLTASISMLPCRGDTSMINSIFEPLGYTVEYKTSVLDEKYPEWGEGKYVNLTIHGKTRLQLLLNHLYVLIPVFDRQKHYWFGRDEVDKLVSHGEGWLENHPEKELISKRYMGGRNSLARLAMENLQLDMMDDGQAGAVEIEGPSDVDEHMPKPPSLNTRRLSSVVDAVKKAHATSVIDLGCGEGKLLSLLIKERSLTKIAGMDVSWQSLERASKRLRLDRMPDAMRDRISLFQSSLTYKDERFSGYDVACVIEVIEHLDINRLNAFEQILFGVTKPRTVIITTPNIDYNENYEFLKEGNLRHSDHRFEWSREEFEKWTEKISIQYGYTVEMEQIGDEDEENGTPTQMGVFTKCE